MTKDKYEDKYTDPDLRRQLKEEISKSDKGGKPGQWSARKSQLLVSEYEKHGGGYKKDEKDDAAKSLEEWSEQDWQTEDNSDRARDGKVTKRYLPKEVWDSLSEKEKQEAERSKEEASKKGQQHVEWTPAVKKVMDDYEAKFEQEHSNKHEHRDEHSRKHVNSDEPSQKELNEQAKELNIEGRSKMSRQELLDAIRKTQR